VSITDRKGGAGRVAGNPARWASRVAGLAIAAAPLAALALASSARALPFELIPSEVLPGWLDLRTAYGLAILTGLVIFATTLAILHIRERDNWTTRERELAAEIERLRDASTWGELVLGSEGQVIVVWTGRDGEVEWRGDPAAVTGDPNPKRLLAFGSWLRPAAAGELDAACERLRATGEGFRLDLSSQRGGHVEAEGRAVAGRALLRLRDVSGFRERLLHAEQDATALRAEMGSFRQLLDAIPLPVWLRGPDGRLGYVNRAYAAAVDAPDPSDAVTRSLELLERSDRESSARRRSGGEAFQARVAAIVAGARRVLDITETPLAGGSGGSAQDVSEIDVLRGDLARLRQAQIRTLDQLPTAVAMFDARQRLVFHNAAYRALWDLDAAFLDTLPSEGEILDRLRADRKLPEQADFRSWKAGLLEAYRAVEPQQTWWHLPDRRTLRVTANPSPGGGLTYLFHDLSERIQLESRYNALTRVQGETLNALHEGVALFGADGRLKLFNRAFASMWRLDEGALAQGPHVDEIVRGCTPLAPDAEPWEDLRSAVSGIHDVRVRFTARMERLDGAVLDCAAEPLPDGATVLTFTDATASVNVERALTERNDALEQASRIRNEFVHHLSYELRSPLTTIIGFAELLGAETVGPLNSRQRDYADHITRSSGALLAIINDILDLASIDADTIELVREPVNIRETIEAAARGLDDRLVEAGIRLDVDAPPGIGNFEADGRRVRQILFNLLSNAVAFSSPGQTVRVSARRVGADVVLTVADQGRGIPREIQDRVFERAGSRPAADGYRGVGLGLSIVRALVELHGGRVELTSETGRGTLVTCTFPGDGRPLGQIAAE
jgi:signal transduction histidine kinase